MNIWIGKSFPVSTVFAFAYVKHCRLNGTIATFSGDVGRAGGWVGLLLVEGNR